MTPEEQMAVNAKEQKDANDTQFKREARMKALHIARDMKLSASYSANSLNQS